MYIGAHRPAAFSHDPQTSRHVCICNQNINHAGIHICMELAPGKSYEMFEPNASSRSYFWHRAYTIVNRYIIGTNGK